MTCKISIPWLFSATCVSLLCSSCSQAPAIDLMGSLFPAWLLCIALGILFTVLARWLLLRYRFQLFLTFLAYPCLAAIFTFSIWLVFF